MNKRARKSWYAATLVLLSFSGGCAGLAGHCLRNHSAANSGQNHSATEGPTGETKMVTVSGFVLRPGTFPIPNTEPTLATALGMAGDLDWDRIRDAESGSLTGTALIAITRQDVPYTRTYFLPATLVAHPLISMLKIKNGDAIRVVTLDQTSLAFADPSLRESEIPLAPGARTRVAKVQLDGERTLLAGDMYYQPFDDVERFPTLNNAAAALARKEPANAPPPSYWMITRRSRFGLAWEIFLIPAAKQRLGNVAANTRNYVEAVQIHNGDSIHTTDLETSPLVLGQQLDQLLEQIQRKREATAAESRHFRTNRKRVVFR